MGADVAIVIRRVCLAEVNGEVVIVGEQVLRTRVIFIVKVRVRGGGKTRQ